MEKEGEGGAMVPAKAPQSASQTELILKEMGLGGISSLVLTSLDQSAKEGRILLFKLLNQSLPHLDDVVNQTIAVTDYLVTPVELVNEESGELKRVPLIRMIDAKGEGWQTTAPAVLKALLQYNHHIRQAPWKPAARFVVRQHKSGNMRKYFALELPEGEG